MPELEGRRRGNERKRGVAAWRHWEMRRSRLEEGEEGSDRAQRRAGEEGEDARTVRAEIFLCRPNGVDYSDEEADVPSRYRQEDVGGYEDENAVVCSFDSLDLRRNHVLDSLEPSLQDVSLFSLV